MKTPRQVLFECHRSVQPKLDAARQDALSRLGLISPPETAPDSGESPQVCRVSILDRLSSFLYPLSSLRPLLRSLRWHLAGLGAVWLAVALLNVDPASPSAPAMVKRNAPSARQLLLALRENRRQLLELIEPAIPVSSPAPSSAVPPRRSELPPSTAMA